MKAMYITIQSLPSHFLCYYPVRDHMRFSGKTTVLAVACCLLVQGTIYGWVADQYPAGVLVEYLFAPVFLAVFFLCVKLEVFRLLFLYVFSASYTVATKGLAAFLGVRFLGSFGTELLPSIGLHLLVVLVTIPLVLRALDLTRSQVLYTNAPLLWKTIWLAPCLTIVIALTFTWNIQDQNAASISFLLVRVAVPASAMAVYSVLLQSLGSVRACAVAEEESRQRDQLLALQRNQYAQLQRYIQETRQARHDLRQHLNLIQAYLNRGEEEALRDYIAAYGKSLPQDSDQRYCENVAADTIIRYYADAAKNRGICFRCHAKLPAKLPVREPDLCALLGNLLENALDACLENHQGTAYIHLNILMEDAVIAITVDNPSPRKPEQRDGCLISAKDGHSGVGTQSVNAIARLYGGSALFEWVEGEFRASVLLKVTGRVI